MRTSVNESRLMAMYHAGAVRIPMAGQAESLNLAAAAAICLYATERARADGQDQGPAGAVSPLGE